MKRLAAVDRRRSILEAALIVLARAGYAGMTTAAVARQVGVSEPILYRHFASKRAILQALLQDISFQMLTAFRALSEKNPDPATALRQICRAYLDLSHSYEREFQVINQALVESKDSKTRAILRDHYNAYRDFLQGLIQQGQEQGVIRRDVAPAVFAWHIIHSALGFLMTRPIRNEVESARDLESLMEVTLGGLWNRR